MDRTEDMKNWLRELETPTDKFFEAFAQRLKLETSPSEGARAATREAIAFLTPRVHWEGYLPHIPHGLLGLWAVFRLEGYLEPRRFLRGLAAQLHLFATEGRARKSLLEISSGSGSWENLRLAFDRFEPSLAWGEAMGFEAPQRSDFHRLAVWAGPDMASVGHKSVMAHRLGDLAGMIGGVETARILLAISAWLGASQPVDLFWQARIQKRLGEHPASLPEGAGALGESSLARGICEWGLVELLDGMALAVRNGISRGEFLVNLAQAAISKQLDARRELEGKTSWNFVYLASVAEVAPADALAWCRAAALVNLFPSGEEEQCLQPRAPKAGASLLELILDGEVREAMFLAEACYQTQSVEALLKALAEAVMEDDPHGHYGYPLLALASAADWLPALPGERQKTMLIALAKLLANARGSCDLANRASAALERELG